MQSKERAESADAALHPLEEALKRSPNGAFAVAGLATAIVLLLYFAFYFLAYLPRGVVQ